MILVARSVSKLEALAHELVAHAYRPMMKGQVLSVHGALNWLGMESLRLAPRSVARKLAAGLNKPPS